MRTGRDAHAARDVDAAWSDMQDKITVVVYHNACLAHHGRGSVRRGGRLTRALGVGCRLSSSCLRAAALAAVVVGGGGGGLVGGGGLALWSGGGGGLTGGGGGLAH